MSMDRNVEASPCFTSEEPEMEKYPARMEGVTSLEEKQGKQLISP